MTQCAALRISSPLPHNADSGQGERTEPGSDFNSTQVAQSTMVCRDYPQAQCKLVDAKTHPPPRVMGLQSLWQDYAKDAFFLILYTQTHLYTNNICNN